MHAHVTLIRIWRLLMPYDCLFCIYWKKSLTVFYWLYTLVISEQQKKKGESAWMRNVGTLADKMKSSTLIVQASPIHTLQSLEKLVDMVSKKGRREALMALGRIWCFAGLALYFNLDKKRGGYLERAWMILLYCPIVMIVIDLFYSQKSVSLLSLIVCVGALPIPILFCFRYSERVVCDWASPW